MPHSTTPECRHRDNQPLGDLKGPSDQTPRALSCYKKTLDISPYRLGMLITGNSLEIHLIAVVDNEPHILDQIELTGAREKERTIQTPDGTVLITKQDRGRVRFVFLEQLMAVTFSNLSRPGGMHVSILSAHLDARGKPKHGATYQSYQTIFVPRLPSHEEDIQSLRSAVATNNQTYHGLADPFSVSEFCRGLKDTFANWENLRSRERILAIRLVANETLLKSGVYPCYFPEGQISDWSAFSPHKLCRFVPTEWSMYRSPAFVDEDNLTRQEQLQFATTLYEELRNVEQCWDVLRYVTGKDTGILDAARLPAELAKVAMFAQHVAIPQDHRSVTRYDMLLDSITCETRDADVTSFLGAFYRHEPNLSLEQRVRRKLHLPYLYHQRDAAAVSDLVWREWQSQVTSRRPAGS